MTKGARLRGSTGRREPARRRPHKPKSGYAEGYLRPARAVVLRDVLEERQARKAKLRARLHEFQAVMDHLAETMELIRAQITRIEELERE